MANEELDVDINLILEQGADIQVDEERLEALVAFVLRDVGASGKWEVAIVLTSDQRLRELHRDFMGIDAETDVMTFPADPIPGEVASGGDIVISVDRAAEQGAEFGHTREEETEYLVAHGLLHLCGWDDHSDADRVRMLAFQDKLIDQFIKSWIERQN
jgi:probable rRNA maturation factor